MGTVHTDKIKPGMVIADEVRDISGRLLLAQGKKIQPEHLRIFKIWGVMEVSIMGVNGSETATENSTDPDEIAKTEELTKLAFRHVDLAHPASKELFKLSVAYRCQNGCSEAPGQLVFKENQIQETAPPHKKKHILGKLTKKNIKLPEIPSIVFELNEVIANPLSSAENIAHVVNKSPSLTALLLKIVNSSFYGLPSRIDKISLAVTMIGTREISGLALGISILSIFKNIPKEILDMYSFLKHSLACGVIARLLAAQKNLPQTEQMFVSGLLHDLGRLVLYIYFPKEACYVLSCAGKSEKLLYEEEADYLGCDHAYVSKELMGQWKLPLILENNVFFHHKPSASPQPDQATIVHVADIIVNALGIGTSGEKYVPPLDHVAWDNLELSPSCFEMVIRQATHQFISLESILSA